MRIIVYRVGMDCMRKEHSGVMGVGVTEKESGVMGEGVAEKEA